MLLHDPNHEWGRYKVLKMTFPAMIRKEYLKNFEDINAVESMTSTSSVGIEGALLCDLNDEEFRLLDFFEDDEYELTDVKVELKEGDGDGGGLFETRCWAFPNTISAKAVIERPLVNWSYEKIFLSESGTAPE